MRTARLLTSALLAAAAALGPAASLAYAKNDPGSAGSLELWPTSASPGATVTANTTACGSAGHATGDANTVGAGDFQLTTSTHKEVLAGQFQVASHTKPGSFRIKVSCENGKTVEAQLTVAAGGGDRDHERWGKDGQGDGQWHGQGNKDPWSKEKPWDGAGQWTKDKSWDTNDRSEQWGRDKSWDGHDPHGHVKTGVGGSIRPDTTLIAAGAAVLTAAAVGGTWLLRRRASGTQGRG
ncbi:hypothetical protein SXANM310S_05886 [Streptomyces xanthochromogenes]